MRALLLLVLLTAPLLFGCGGTQLTPQQQETVKRVCSEEFAEHLKAAHHAQLESCKGSAICVAAENGAYVAGLFARDQVCLEYYQ